ncbi:condensation domain-containing protein, partial [Kitasatospora sp. NPDC001574]
SGAAPAETDWVRRITPPPARAARWRPWRFRMSNDVWGTPVVADGTLFVSSFEVHALDIASGQRRYKTRDVAWALAVDAGRVHAADGPHLYTVDVADGADLQAGYLARLAGRAPEFAELPVQYADFALWQASLDQAAPLAHWRRALAGLPEEIPLPVDRPRPAVPSGRGDTVGFAVPADVAERLRALAADHGATPFMVVHAAVAALLHRLGGGDDVPLGTPVAGRGGEAALDGLVGFFVNTVVLRADLSGDPTFAELLDRVRAADLAALDHADVPFGRVVEVVNPPRALGRHPLFQTLVSHNTVTLDTSVMFGHPARMEQVDPGTARFDLEFTFADTAHGDDLDLRLFYSADLFDRPTAEALSGRLLRLLEQAVADPAARVDDLELLDPAELAGLLAPGEAVGVVPVVGSVVERFEGWVREAPGAVALVVG